jgi:hypothetical protein
MHDQRKHYEHQPPDDVEENEKKRFARKFWTWLMSCCMNQDSGVSRRTD